MPSGSAGRRYAQAVFELAQSTNQLDLWASDLEVIKLVFEDRAVSIRLENPKVTQDKKVALVSQILKGKISQPAYSLAILLVNRQRQAFAGAIYTEYNRLLNNLRGIAEAEVTTAVEMDPATEARVIEQLTKITGKQILMTKKVDPSILGGIVARVGDTLIDGSLKSRLQALRKSLA
jgi:F-type H+-transporting ATPase subunit delta